MDAQQVLPGSGRSDGGRVNILLVDDNDSKRMALEAALEPLGQNIVQAESGRDALRLLLNEDYAVILLDVRMPGMDGFETAALIRSRQQTESTPIIFVTAYDRAETDMLDGYALGAVDYIFAPVVPEILRAKVSVFVDLYKKTEAIKQHEQLRREHEALKARRTQDKLKRETERVRKSAEQEMRKLSSALEQTADPVFICNQSGLIEYVNPAFERVTGYSKAEAIGQPPEKLRSAPNDDSFTQHLRRVLSEGRVYRGEIVQRRKDGTLFVEENTITPIKDEHGQITHLVSTGRDVTERKRTEAQVRQLNAALEERVRERTAQLEDLNRELEAFAYSVSHDLRTPLRHMASFAELLRKELGPDPSDKARRYLDIIGTSAGRMDALIADLLSFSRTGRQDLRIVPVDLGLLVQDVWQELSSEITHRHVEFRPPDLPTVAADIPTLRQVFVNLLSNALKYSRTRELACIEVGYAQEGPEHVLYVRDNGVGFDPAYAHKLFGVFQRLHKSEDFEGTGIGLANVRRIVTKHGGRTWAEGRPGEGATFYFSLPRRENLQLTTAPARRASEKRTVSTAREQ
ncbi:PAS domain S-box protein [Deinococcus peraridilitoris]|uniref:histidine kinase n=1 Tax=Deinococcus peraridilitoris (strain DSM 19664 / LMG 22246 / CIP 109416 / KR-200) TaxID=937777 RepID=L0A1V9_DEIPD|nr:PAS domain S-box protein [Deinococcus peraridilitoris]AFZ67888.1 PAS domain S-box [Deinococcus peraridilitoris DSM 19664]